MRASVAWVAWLATSTAVLGCKAPLVEPSSPDGTRMESLALTSKSFPSNGDIPVDFTCDGAERSPELTWSAPPPGTKTFALVLEDPDASSGTFTHWIAYNIDPEARELAEGADVGAVSGASGLNDSKRPTYAGPCPPRLEIHHYFFRIYALDAALKVRPEPDRDAIDAAMNGHVLGEGALMFTFSH